jgi:hypothetical protein
LALFQVEQLGRPLQLYELSLKPSRPEHSPFQAFECHCQFARLRFFAFVTTMPTEDISCRVDHKFKRCIVYSQHFVEFLAHERSPFVNFSELSGLHHSHLRDGDVTVSPGRVVIPRFQHAGISRLREYSSRKSLWHDFH